MISSLFGRYQNRQQQKNNNYHTLTAKYYLKIKIWLEINSLALLSLKSTTKVMHMTSTQPSSEANDTEPLCEKQKHNQIVIHWNIII